MNKLNCTTFEVFKMNLIPFRLFIIFAAMAVTAFIFMLGTGGITLKGLIIQIVFWSFIGGLFGGKK